MKKTLNIAGNAIDLTIPKVMGILNVTPDSFFDGGKHNSDNAILKQAEKMLSEGAAIIDIGGYSSRPGADEVSATEEASRVIKATRLIAKEFGNAIISIDTFRAEVAHQAIDTGAHIINDITAGNEEMYSVVAKHKVPYIMMHMRGTPQNMTQQTDYEDLIGELMDYFVERINTLKKMGIHDIIIDPGFGFAKTIDQNFEILNKLKYFHALNLPLLVGVSRKSMIYKTLDTTPSDALNGTSALHMVSLMNGAQILRVHDVKEAVECVQLFKATYP